MSKLDELKEKIAFSTKLFFVLGGLVIILISGLLNLYIDNNINEIFWLGICVITILVYLNYIVFAHIRKYIEEIGKL